MMPALSPGRYRDAIAAATEDFARLITGADLARPVPSCPDWTLKQLATHVGRAQRWAAEIARTRSPGFIEFRAVPDGAFPKEPGAQPDWLRAGAWRLIAALREAGDEPVWAFGGLVPASFWIRRMAHETGVHLADARLALGEPPGIPADLAADAVDEWLTYLSGPIYGRPDPRRDALPAGRSLHVHATDTAGEWLVSHDKQGIRAESGHAGADVSLRGPAETLLLVLIRRIGPDSPAVEVHGDAGLLRHWLDHTPF
jgi:uncharacterized protein (TIGR03083 family)